MKDNSDRMDKAIKDKFEGHEVHAPSNLWKSIESKLPPEKGNTRYSSFLKNPFTISILVVSTVLGAYLFYSTLKKPNTLSDSFNSNTLPEPTQNTFSVYDQRQDKNGLSKPLRLNKVDTSNTDNNNLTSLNCKEADVQSTYTSIKNTSKKSASLKQQNEYSAESTKNKNLTNNTQRSNNTLNQSSTKSNSNRSSNKTLIKSTTNETSSSFASTAAKQSNNENTLNKSSRSIASTNNNQSEDKKNLLEKNESARHSDSTHAVFSHLTEESNSTNTEKNHSNNALENTLQTNLNYNKQAIENTSLNNQQTNLNNSGIARTSSAGIHDSLIHSSENRENTEQHKGLTESDSNELLSQSSDSNSTNSQENNLLGLTTTQSANNKNTIEDSSNASSAKTDEITTTALHTDSSMNNNVIAKLDSINEDETIDSSLIKKDPKTVDVSTEEKKRKSAFLSKCSFDGYITPALAFIHTSSNDSNENINTFTTNRNQNTKPGSGITAGLRMNYALTRKIEIGLGFQYSSLSQQSTLTQTKLDSTYTSYKGYTRIDSFYDQQKQQYIYTSHYITTDTLTNNIYSTHTQKYIDKYQSFSIPIHIAYGYSITDRLSLIARTSLIFNYQTYSVTHLNETAESVLAYHSHKNISLGGSFSIGGYYAFSRSYSVFAEPIINYYFSNVFDKQASFKQTQFMLGLQIGVRMSF